MKPINRVVGVVLCGGKGTRMGGVNKGLVDYQNRKLFEYACDNLKALTSNIVINSNTHADTFKAMGFDVIDDAEYTYQGPLAGIYAGLTQTRADFVAYASCDQFTLPDSVYITLYQQALESGAAFAVSGEEGYPTCCVIAARLAPDLKAALDSGQRKLWQWMRNHATAVNFTDIDFANINQLPQ